MADDSPFFKCTCSSLMHLKNYNLEILAGETDIQVCVNFTFTCNLELHLRSGITALCVAVKSPYNQPSVPFSSSLSLSSKISTTSVPSTFPFPGVTSAPIPFSHLLKSYSALKMVALKHNVCKKHWNIWSPIPNTLHPRDSGAVGLEWSPWWGIVL